MNRIDRLFAIALVILFVYWSVIMFIPNAIGPLVWFYYWIQGLTVLIGYPGAFLISFIGNVTVLFPFPYIAVIFILGGASAGPSGPFLFDPWLLGILSGLGATIGEITGYFAGRYTSRYINKEQTSGFLTLINKYPRTTPLVLWFLAVTPIPDDVIIVPLGMAKYPLQKVFVPQLIGKSMFLIGLAWAGRLGIAFVESVVIGDPTSPLTKTIEVVALLVLIIAIYLFLKVDWSKFSLRLKGFKKVEEENE